MNWWQAMLTILLGNVVVLVPMILNAHAGTKYGVSFPVLCRASFGVKGANVPAILRAFVACGWFGIQTWIGGLALNTLLIAFWPAWNKLAGGHLDRLCDLLAGPGVDHHPRPEGIKKLEGWSAPLLLAGGVALLGLGGQSRRRTRTRPRSNRSRLQSGNDVVLAAVPRRR